jgi:hypothetical protein
MKKNILTYLIFLILLCISVFSQVTGVELTLKNTLSTNVIFKVYPVSMIFNYNRDYNLVAHFRTKDANQITIYDYNNGRDKAYLYRQLQNNIAQQYEFDGGGGGPTSVEGSLGYGKYKVSIHAVVGVLHQQRYQ